MSIHTVMDRSEIRNKIRWIPRSHLTRENSAGTHRRRREKKVFWSALYIRQSFSYSWKEMTITHTVIFTWRTS